MTVERCESTCAVFSLSVLFDSLRPHGPYPARLLCPWIFPGKNTRVGCHFLVQGISLTQELNLCLLHWQAGSLSLNHQGSPIEVADVSKYQHTMTAKCGYASLEDDLYRETCKKGKRQKPSWNKVGCKDQSRGSQSHIHMTCKNHILKKQQIKDFLTLESLKRATLIF